MGKGDKKTRRGKIFMGSYGVLRSARKSKPQQKVEETKAPVKKATKKK